MQYTSQLLLRAIRLLAIEENTKEPVINQQETINTEEKVDVNVENKVEKKNIEESN